MPSTPEHLLSTVFTSSEEKPSLSIIKSTTAGSILPLLVPITAPSNGVKPIDVSMDLPPLTAVTLTPFPICRLINLVSLISLFKSFAARLDTYKWLVPWKPYFLTPYFSYHFIGIAYK